MMESIKESELKRWVAMYESSLGERTFKIETIDNDSRLSTVIDEIFKLLVNAYRGNFLTARNSRELLKKTDLAKIAIDSNGSIIACSLYREDLGGKKMTSIGALRDDSLGKEALKAIIRDDIAPYDGWYWAEVSGAIEHFFKKFNGNPIPNVFAAIFLERDSDDLKLESDGVHYTREIGVDHIPFTLFE